MLNFQQAVQVPTGLTPADGSSYGQVVGFNEFGPVADAVLRSSQSTDPASPYFGDQSCEYSAKRWYRLRFIAAAIAVVPAGPVLAISE